MSDLAELYQEIILDHNRSPRNFHEIPDCTCWAEGNNPRCGDEVKVFLRKKGDRLIEAAFQGQGCAISRASASMMTIKVKGRLVGEVLALSEKVRDMLMGEKEENLEDLGDLAALSGVRQFPARITCALLAWHALEKAMDGRHTLGVE